MDHQKATCLLLFSSPRAFGPVTTRSHSCGFRCCRAARLLVDSPASLLLHFLCQCRRGVRRGAGPVDDERRKLSRVYLLLRRFARLSSSCFQLDDSSTGVELALVKLLDDRFGDSSRKSNIQIYL